MLKEYPHEDTLGTRVVPTAFKRTLQGEKVISITEVNKGKLEDLLIRAMKMLAMFRNIEGCEAQVETYMTTEEALGVMGMSLPA